MSPQTEAARDILNIARTPLLKLQRPLRVGGLTTAQERRVKTAHSALTAHATKVPTGTPPLARALLGNAQASQVCIQSMSAAGS